jgi:hypothetical protein
MLIVSLKVIPLLVDTDMALCVLDVLVPLPTTNTSYVVYGALYYPATNNPVDPLLLMDIFLPIAIALALLLVSLVPIVLFCPIVAL